MNRKKELFIGLALAGLVVTPVAACSHLSGSSDPPVTQVCTELDCSDLLTIEITGTAPEDFTVRIADEKGRSTQVHCAESTNVGTDLWILGDPWCSPSGASFSGFAPDRVSVTIVWDGGSFSQTVRPDYSLDYPNGLNCPPVCRSATIEIDLPW